MGETRSPELGKGENGFQLFWFKLFVFVILKPVWKQAGRGLVQKWGSHFFGGWPCKLLRISPSISFPETLSPAGWGCGWALQGFRLHVLASWWFSWAAQGKLAQQDTAGICFTASNFHSLFQSHWRQWDGSSVRSVTSGVYPNVTPFFSTCPAWSARWRIMCKAVQSCLLPSLSAVWGWVLGLARNFPQYSVCR